VSDYTATAQRTLEAITRKGGDVSFPQAGTDSTPDVYDPATGRWTAGAGSAAGSITGKAVQGTNDVNKLAQLNLLTVKTVTLLIAAASLSAPVEPDNGMLMVWANTAYYVRNVETVKPDGVTPILYVVVGAVGNG
jgi:hypothetical protein